MFRFLRKHVTQTCGSMTFALSQTNSQIYIFSGRSHCCRTDLSSWRQNYVVITEEYLCSNL